MLFVEERPRLEALDDERPEDDRSDRIAGTPSESSGIMAPPEQALFADSVAATPSMTPCRTVPDISRPLRLPVGHEGSDVASRARDCADEDSDEARFDDVLQERSKSAFEGNVFATVAFTRSIVPIFYTPAKNSESAKRPIRLGMKAGPSSISTMPKVNLGYPEMGSKPNGRDDAARRILR